MKKPRKKKGNQGKGWGKHVPLRTERQKRILLAMQIDPDFCYLVRQKMAKFYAPIEAKKNTGLILEYWGKRIQADPKAQAMQALEISTGKMVIGPERMLTEVIFPVERKGAKTIYLVFRRMSGGKWIVEETEKPPKRIRGEKLG